MKKKVLAIMWVAVSIMLISACGKKKNYTRFLTYRSIRQIM